ncbi:MAG: SIMPL domain-containing protein [bacterium]|nr:SIMPL domain-containing protein [bacterium]
MEEQKSSNCTVNSTVKIVGIVVLGIILMTIATLIQQAFFLAQTEGTVQFTGQGRVEIKPDMAMLNLDIATFQAKTPEEALNQTTEKTNKLISALEKFGIAEKDRRVTIYSFNVKYKDSYSDDSYSDDSCSDDSYSTTKNNKDKNEQLEKMPKIIGYNGFRRITIKVRGINKDSTKIDNLIKLAVEQGVNNIGSVKFFASNIEKAKQEARKESLKDVKNKAMEASNELGIKLGKLSYISENIISAPGQGYNEGWSDSSSSVSLPNENNPISISQSQSFDPTIVVIETTGTYYTK